MEEDCKKTLTASYQLLSSNFLSSITSAGSRCHAGSRRLLYSRAYGFSRQLSRGTHLHKPPSIYEMGSKVLSRPPRDQFSACPLRLWRSRLAPVCRVSPRF